MVILVWQHPSSGDVPSLSGKDPSMPTSLRALRVRTLVAVALAAALALLTPAGSSARPADHVARAQHRILGSHLTNHHTHVETWIVGYYPYRRRVRIHGHLRPKRFYGLRVSAQHCDRRHCWGHAVHGKLWSPHQPGRPSRHSRASAQPSASAPHSDLCLQGTTSCAAPWNWFSKYVDTRQHELVRRFVNPCATGGLEGGGVVAVTDLSARILLEGGTLTAARAGSAFAGPPGIALGAVSGCMVGEASRGLHTVKSLVGHLNPFGRGARPRG
jgi:hypothetical protein